MRRLTLSLLLVVMGSSGALALSLPFEESDYLPPEETTTYVERSLNHQAPLTIEHPPVPSRRANDRAAIAGFCHSAGYIRRLDAFGRTVVLRQRETCENVAPRQLWPGHVDPRPVWPARPVERSLVVRSKG